MIFVGSRISVVWPHAATYRACARRFISEIVVSCDIVQCVVLCCVVWSHVTM